MQKNVDIELEIGDGLELAVDREDMLELLGNLLDNAFKWSKGRIRLLVVQQASTIRISVEDDGPGIPRDLIKTLMERGARIDEQTDGHGFGLPIVQDIVRLYKGSIELDESESLKGLHVSVILPQSN